MASFTAEEVTKWDVESVAGWLKLLHLDDLVDTFRDNDISGVVLLDLDDELLEEMEVDPAKRKLILQAVEELKRNEGVVPAGAEEDAMHSSDEDEDEEPAQTVPQKSGAQQAPSAPPAHASAAAAAAAPAAPATTAAPKKKSVAVEKSKDPLRLAAKTRAVADLASCTVTSGFLWKVGGSGLKPKHWQRRFFVLTDDNCLYYFKSPKDMAALGMVLLPSFTITVCDKAENPGGRPYAFKAFNRELDGARKYILAAEDEKEMKTWMNVLSLASIAFGSGKASMARPQKGPQQLTEEHDAELMMMQRRAAERAGGVSASGDIIPAAAPLQVARGAIRKSSKGPVPCHVKMLDGSVIQLFAEPNTTGQNFLDQVCDTLKAYEKYYFGLRYTDPKGDEDWVKMDKKILKHIFPKGDVINLEFCIRYYPMDVTQVMQYVTLFQCFLAARQAVLNEELDVSNKDAFLLASLSLQATKGDFNPALHTAAAIAKERLVPERNKVELLADASIKGVDANLFMAEEVIRTWRSLQGILRHLTVLKYIQVIQKHRRFAMQYYDVKNHQGTPLVLGVNPHGLFVFRHSQLHRPVVTFSWAECSELAFTEKKFTIQVHDRETKAFSFQCARSAICQRILNLCIGLHRLYVQTIRGWVDAPPDMMMQRKRAIEAALVEREELKKEAAEVRRKAKEKRKPAGGADPAAGAGAAPAPARPAGGAATSATAPAPAQATSAKVAAAPGGSGAAAPGGAAAPAAVITSPSGETVVIKGREEAVRMMDIMMADEDFMRFQEEAMADMEDSVVEEINTSTRLRSQSFLGRAGLRRAETDDTGEHDNTPISNRAEYVARLRTVGE